MYEVLEMIVAIFFISVDIAYICLNIQLFIHKIQEPICFIRTANMYNFWYNLLNPYIGNGIVVLPLKVYINITYVPKNFIKGVIMPS